MRLTETSSLWGRTYRRAYFLNGKRIPESRASHLLKNHAWEDDGHDKQGGVYRSHWNIGPRLDAPSMTDHPDCS